MMRAKEMLVSKKLKEPRLQCRQAKEGMRMKVQLGERMILGLVLLSLAFPVSPALGKEFPFPMLREDLEKLQVSINPPSERPPKDWERWDCFIIMSKFELPHSYFFGFIDIFAYKVRLEPIPPSYKYLPYAKAIDGDKEKGIFGVRFKFPHGLEKGYEYKFHLRFPMGGEPDYILIGNKKVWDKNKGLWKKGRIIVGDGAWEEDEINYTLEVIALEFNFLAEEDEKYLWLVKRLKSGDKVTIKGPGSSYSCIRKKLPSDFSYPSYQKIELPKEIKFYSLPSHLRLSTLKTQYYEEPVEWRKKPLKKPNYPTSEVKILATILCVPEKQKGYRLCLPGTPPPQAFKIAAESGIDGPSVGPYGNIKKIGELRQLPQNGLELIKSLGMNSLFLGAYPFIVGKWAAGKDSEQRLNILLKNISFITKNYPEFKIYVQLPEIEAYNWKNAYKWWRTKKYPLSLEKNLEDMSEVERTREIIRAQKWWKDQVLEHLAKEAGKDALKNIVWTYQTACSFFPHAYLYKEGADLIVCKNIHRENLNIAVANTRGNAKAYGKEYGLEHDCWWRENFYTYHPREIAQIFPALFFSGASLIFTEIVPFAVDKKGKVGPNKVGVELLKFCRMAKTHPRRGKQIVKIAFMRGNGVNGRALWRYFIRAFNDRPDEILTIEKDFNPLDIFFYKWGRNNSTYSDRLLTGTPYGPVDIIPWDVSLEKLKEYDLVIFANNINIMDEKQYETLKNYVKEGGTLVMAQSQLRYRRRKYFKLDLTDLFGCHIGKRAETREDGRTINYVHLIPEGCKILERFENGEPLLIENKIGKGKAYLFSTEYLTDKEEVARTLVKKLAEEVKLLEFSPFSGWIEYMVQKKGNIYIIPVLNHGRGCFPSGNGIDYGLWKGKITVDLKKLDLPEDIEGYKVEWQEEKDEFNLRPLKIYYKADNKIAFNISVDKWCEIILGPKGKTKEEFFFGKDK